MNQLEEMREKCAQLIEQTRIYSSSPKNIFDISQDARNEQAKAIRALPVPEVNQEPVAYFKADQDGNLIWGEDCVSDDAIFDFSDDGESNETSIPLYRLPPDVEALRKENERLSTVEYCFNEWLEKTKWVQETARPHELGMHRADVLRNRIEVLQKEKDELLNALKRLINSDPTGEIPNASDDDLQAAVNDENAGPIVREQAASILQARAAIFKAEGCAA